MRTTKVNHTAVDRVWTVLIGMEGGLPSRLARGAHCVDRLTTDSGHTHPARVDHAEQSKLAANFGSDGSALVAGIAFLGERNDVLVGWERVASSAIALDLLDLALCLGPFWRGWGDADVGKTRRGRGSAEQRLLATDLSLTLVPSEALLALPNFPGRFVGTEAGAFAHLAREAPAAQASLAELSVAARHDQLVAALAPGRNLALGICRLNSPREPDLLGLGADFDRSADFGSRSADSLGARQRRRDTGEATGTMSLPLRCDLQIAFLILANDVEDLLEV
mmetsp:Transcript_38776/g.82376  ORF Transcript_38776/g.82376 Transcript_38776/m.82376 type:complete len:279 (+) Transcript_38776:215-1051(+)